MASPLKIHVLVMVEARCAECSLGFLYVYMSWIHQQGDPPASIPDSVIPHLVGSDVPTKLCVFQVFLLHSP